MSVVFALFSVAFLTDLPKSQGFKCWLCSTESDKRCGDPFNATVLLKQEECNPVSYYGSSTNQYVCRKIKHLGPNDQVIVSRMCTANGERENDPCSPLNLHNYVRVQHCSTCNTELCNGASSTFSYATLMISPVIYVLSKINFF